MTKEHHCYGCRFYKAYYTKGGARFEKLTFGFCEKKQNNLCDKYGICEEWQSAYRRNATRKRVALLKMIELADNVAVVKQILCENDEE